MAKLIEQIRDQAIDSSISVGDVLRRCKVLAARIGDHELEAWVDLELNGYPADAIMPSYRVVEHPLAIGDFIGIANSQFRNAPISIAALPEKVQKSMGSWAMHKPLATFEEVLKHGAEHGFVIVPWRAEVLGLVDQFDMACVKAWYQIPTQLIAAMLETVRNRVLNYVLELEKKNPDAGEAVAVRLAPEVLHQVFTNNITGNVGNLAQASPGAIQTAYVNVSRGDSAGLERALKEAGVPELDMVELRQAIVEEPPQPNQQELGPRVSQWFTKTVLKLGKTVAVEMAARAIASYFGLPI